MVDIYLVVVHAASIRVRILRGCMVQLPYNIVWEGVNLFGMLTVFDTVMVGFIFARLYFLVMCVPVPPEVGH